MCARRGDLWRAGYYLETLRAYTVELACLRAGLESKNYRDVRLLPPATLAELERTLVERLEAEEILRALRAAAACFFVQARALDAQLGEDHASRLQAHMEAILR